MREAPAHPDGSLPGDFGVLQPLHRDEVRCGLVCWPVIQGWHEIQAVHPRFGHTSPPNNIENEVHADLHGRSREAKLLSSQAVGDHRSVSSHTNALSKPRRDDGVVVDGGRLDQNHSRLGFTHCGYHGFGSTAAE
jgi:hypothetical protein